MGKTDLRVVDLEGDVKRQRAAIDVLVRYKDFLVELVGWSLNSDSLDTVRATLAAGVKTAMDFEAELSKAVSTED